MSETADIYERRVLHEFQRFVLSRTSTVVREDIYKNMIKNTLFAYAATDGTLSYGELKKYIQKDYPIKNLPELHLDTAIEYLVGDGSLDLVNEKLSLSQTTKNQIKKEIKESDEEQEEINNYIQKTLQEKLPSIKPHQISLIVNNLHLVLADSFAHNGTTTAKILTRSSNGMSELKSLSGFEENYCTKILNVVSKEYHNKLDEIFHHMFSNPSEEFSKYLFSLAQSYVYLGVLNIDPQLQQIQKLSWSKKNIYFDTNALLHLLFPSSSMHDTLHTLAKLTKGLGANLLITEKTAIEYETFLENSKEKFRSITFRPKYASAYDDAQSENPFLSSYIDALKKNSKLHLDTFSKAFEEYDRLIDSQYGMTVEDIDKTIDLESDSASRLKVHLTAHRPWKTDKTVTHDAYNILRVRKLRESGSDETGPVAWLLTTDNSLGVSERDTFPKSMPFASVTPDIWLQIISPFVSPTLTIKERSVAFSKLLSSRFKSHKMDMEDFNVFLSLFMDDSKFKVEHLRIIMGLDFAKEKIHELAEKASKGEEITFKQFEPIMRKGLAAVEEDYNQKFADSAQEHSIEMTKVRKELDGLKNEIETLKQEKTTIEKTASELKIKKETAEIEVTKTKSATKFIILAIIASAIINIFAYFGTSMIPDIPVYAPIAAVIALMGIETKIILEIPKRV